MSSGDYILCALSTTQYALWRAEVWSQVLCYYARTRYDSVVKVGWVGRSKVCLLFLRQMQAITALCARRLLCYFVYLCRGWASCIDRALVKASWQGASS